MGRQVILDTNLLIDYERASFDIASLDDDDLAIAAISVAEYRTGIELADNAERAAARSHTLTRIVSAIAVLDYTEATARQHARLLSHTRLSGRKRSAHDLIIAAHAAETGRLILSRDALARFGELPGVHADQPSDIASHDGAA